MLLNNSLDGGQAHARPFEVFGAVQALEHSEEFVGVLHVEAHAVIAHEHSGRFLLMLKSYFDDGLLPRAGKLDGVREQVLKNLLHQSGIALHEGQLANLPFNLPTPALGVKFRRLPR